MKYLLDADVFITAKNTYYPFDVVPGFWECLDEFSTVKTIGSIDKVKEELARGKDELSDWVDKHLSPAFVSTNNPDIIEPYARIINWVEGNSQFKPSAKSDFAAGSDGWLIAYAKANGCVVVTNEAFNPEIKKKVPIPNVCRQFNVSYINTFELLKELGVKFVLTKTTDGQINSR